MNTELYHLLALQHIKGIGDVLSRKLLEHFGSASAIFKASAKKLREVDNIDQQRLSLILKELNHKEIEREIKFMQEHEVTLHSIIDESYPSLLKQIPDAPYLLFSKGKAQLNPARPLAIVGTRNNTPQGKLFTEELIKELKKYQPTIVSGLAYGIDIIAHKAALENNLPTIGVLAHGLDRIYPPEHKNTASKMLEEGGLLTEFPSNTQPEKGNFPARNRIVAGMSLATLVIETNVKGGAMITAKLALSYNRDVFALPGRYNDPRSAGCHYLIQTNIAQLFTAASDIANFLNWDAKETKKQKAMQAKLFETFSANEQTLLNLLAQKEQVHVDELQIKTGFTSSALATLLLQLEFQNTITSLPGKRYALA